jgi:hypothetical protein
MSVTFLRAFSFPPLTKDYDIQHIRVICCCKYSLRLCLYLSYILCFVLFNDAALHTGFI